MSSGGPVRALLKWILGPLAVALVFCGLGQGLAVRRDQVYAATARLPPAERAGLESAPALAVANATWAFGSVDAVKKMARIELDRLPESEGPRRARVYLRFGIVDTNPDGQAALFGQAWAADPKMGNQGLKDAAVREVHARFVAPGNVLPLFFLGGHPPISGPAAGPGPR